MSAAGSVVDSEVEATERGPHASNHVRYGLWVADVRWHGKCVIPAAKHGVEGLTKVAALDYAEQGIRVNALAPGPILTDNLSRAGSDAQHAAANAMPLKRIGDPQEVAAAEIGRAHV